MCDTSNDDSKLSSASRGSLIIIDGAGRQKESNGRMSRTRKKEGTEDGAAWCRYEYNRIDPTDTQSSKTCVYELVGYRRSIISMLVPSRVDSWARTPTPPNSHTHTENGSCQRMVVCAVLCPTATLPVWLGFVVLCCVVLCRSVGSLIGGGRDETTSN